MLADTGNTGKYTARRFPTGSFLESTETFVNVESLTAAHFKFLGLFISDGYVRESMYHLSPPNCCL